MASASPAEKKGRKGKAAAAPVASPSASPEKKTLADFFKPKSSPSPAAAPAATASTKAKAEAAASTTGAPGGGNGQVWVNTETKIYHKEGSRYYGKTEKGKYMTEAEAIKEGNRAAKNE